jgi:hypothetical protein
MPAPARVQTRADTYIYDFSTVLAGQREKKCRQIRAIELASWAQALYIRPPVARALSTLFVKAPTFVTRFTALPPEWRNW